MKIIFIAWKNCWQKAGATSLTLLLLSFGVGIISMMLLLENQLNEKFNKNIKDIDFVEGIDDNTDTVIVILVDNAKYVLNGNPDSVLNTDLTNFKITKRIDIDTLVKKIGK